jgi:two-component system, OmpR family, sensor histidine kinase CiaH
MKMFDTAYLRLTGWYVAIIMTISLLFSGWVYMQARQELQFGLNRIVQIGPDDLIPSTGLRALIEDRLDDSRRRLLMRLTILNLAVLALGAAASYFLARRTMQPIEEAVEAQHRFTADASHELRTPLAAMKTEIEVGLRDKKLTKDDAVTLLQSNLEEIDRLGTLAEGLLALTKADAPLDLLPVGLEDVTGRVVKRLQPLAAAKDLAVRTDLQPVRVYANDDAVEKIVEILLDNAIKYSPAKSEIAVKTYQKDGFGYSTVIDHGLGIKATELPHVFDRFYRADTSRSKAHVTGHGLGLSIAQKLAADLNGEIIAASKPGEGSTFTLKVPVANA